VFGVCWSLIGLANPLFASHNHGQQNLNLNGIELHFILCQSSPSASATMNFDEAAAEMLYKIYASAILSSVTGSPLNSTYLTCTDPQILIHDESCVL
jgi:hypothetical protein